MPITRTTVSRDDSIYEMVPDVVRLPNGRLICIYREGDGHSAHHFSRIVYRESRDSGHSWSDKRVLVAATPDQTGVMMKWNCPRIQRMKDGRLLALCDIYPHPPGEKTDLRNARVVFWWSEDDGQTWSEPTRTEVCGIVPDRVVELPSGAWLLGTHVCMRGDEFIDRAVYSGTDWKLAQVVFRSEDQGSSWEGPIIVGRDSRYNLCEGSILLLPGDQLVCYMRETSALAYPGMKAFSSDEGRTWDGVYETPMAGCHRPVAGLLPSGRVLVTYRYRQSGARGNYSPGGRSASATWTEDWIGYSHHNTFAYLETVESAKARDLLVQGGRILPLDHDSSPRSDSGYTGWVVLHDGTIFCVNYINDDAPMAQIRGYWFRESDI